MSSCKAYASSHGTATPPTEAESVRYAPVAHPVEPFVAAVTSAQLAYFNFVGQATLAWFDITVGRFVTQAARATSGQSKASPKAAMSSTDATKRSHFAEINGADWLSMPAITGIEETFNNRLAKPRAARAQEMDVLTLWKRSNEFETAHLAASQTAPPEAHHEVA